MVNLKEKTFFLISGASRGIGQEMAIQLSNKFAPGSVMVLLARSLEGLKKTKEMIETKLGEEKNSIKVLTFSIDLSKAKALDFQKLLEQSFEESGTSCKDFEKAFIIHNAGTVGDVSKKAKDFSDTDIWTSYFHMNMFSVVSLNSEFLKAMKNLPILVVNISSKCAVVPFSSMSMYCTGKAARDMYFRCLAVEENILVLNYAPGAIDTSMTVLVQKESFDPVISSYFKDQRDAKTMLTVDKTTLKFIEILEKENFQSGDHIDYWD